MKFSAYTAIFIFLGIGAVVSLVISPFIFSSVFGDIKKPEKKNVLCGQIALIWDSVERAQSYSLYRNDELVYNGPVPEYIDRPLVFGDSYEYLLKALNKGGESEFSEKSILVATEVCPPEEPKNIKVLESSCGGEVALGWDEVPMARLYQVARKPIPGFTGTIFQWFSENIIYEGELNEFFEDGLQVGGKYSYMIRAGNQTGWSQWEKRSVTASKICPPEKPLPPEKT